MLRDFDLFHKYPDFTTDSKLFDYTPQLSDELANGKHDTE